MNGQAPPNIAGFRSVTCREPAALFAISVKFEDGAGAALDLLGELRHSVCKLIADKREGDVNLRSHIAHSRDYSESD